MSFLEYQFPKKLALMAIGGPSYDTTVNLGFSGYEQRNKNWTQSRNLYTVAFEHKPQADYNALLAMFHAAAGKANAFRLFDPRDYNGTGQYIATGDGNTKIFQLQKTYTGAGVSTVRPIQKPITSLINDFEGNALTDTVTVYLNGTAKSHSAGYHTAAGHDYTLDETTGLVTFGTAPGSGVVITADYQYHVPVRFDLDEMDTQYETPLNAPQGILYTVTGIKLIEVRIVPGASS